MEQLIQKVEEAIHDFDGTLILNANDPNVVRLKDAAVQADARYFAMERCEESKAVNKEASEGKFCPRCGGKLIYDFTSILISVNTIVRIRTTKHLLQMSKVA